MKNLIYALCCPITGNPVYVGKTTKGLKRPFTHLAENSHSDKVNEWANYLNSIGKPPVVLILEECSTDSFLSKKETFWINYYLNEGVVLLNQTGINAAYFKITEFNTINSEDPLVDIRNFIKIKRKLNNLTQEELSKKSGIGLRFIREIESSKKITFRFDVLFKLVKFLGHKDIKIAIV